MFLTNSANKGVILILVACFSQNEALPSQPDIQEYCPPYGCRNTSKKCLLREKIYSFDYWNHLAGYNCYIYTNDARFIEKYKIGTFRVYCQKCNRPSENYMEVPGAKVNDSTMALFDYRHTESLNLLRKSFKNDEMFRNYVKCCQEADECCEDVMTNSNIAYAQDSCPVIWDAWSCFPRTPVNTIATLPCSSQAYQSPDKICTLKSEKECFWNETTQLAEWNQRTNYAVCAIPPVYLKRYNYHVIALWVCIVCSIPAIVIFFVIPTFRGLTRVILHRNLLIAIVIRNIFTIMAKKLVIIDALQSGNLSNRVMENNPVWCRVLAFFMSAATNSTYACMLVDGYYLHKVIVRTFAKEPPIYLLYSVVGVLTFLPSLIWLCLVAANGRVSCWMVDSNGEQWSVDSFRVVILIINTILLLDIIRIMLSKMKQGGTTKQTKAAFRATLFLIPLFGLHIFITAKKVVIDDTCLAEDVYDYFRYTMEASQGIFVALLFCYANAEVHHELNNAWRKIKIYLNQKLGWNFDKGISRRRTTTATYVNPSEFRSDF